MFVKPEQQRRLSIRPRRSEMSHSSILLNTPRISFKADTMSSPISTTSPITDMEQLKAELGDQAYLLQYAPFSKLMTVPVPDDESNSLSFALLLGYIRSKTFDIKQELYVYMYPATETGQSLQILFHAHEHDDSQDGNKSRCVQYDGGNITKILTGYAAAFKLPGDNRMSKAKLVALAKYYFLKTLVQKKNGEDYKKMRYGLPMGKGFKDDLRAVCREFEEEAKRASAIGPVSRAAQNAHGTQDSDLSDLPSSLLDEEAETSAMPNHALTTIRVTEGSRITVRRRPFPAIV
jgi:hypothetical protein